MDRLGAWLKGNLNWLKSQLTRRGRALHEAEDLIQEGIVRVYEYQARGGEVREPEAVLVRTVIRLSLNEKRQPHRNLLGSTVFESLSVADPGLLPEETLDIRQRLDHVLHVLESVPPRTREVFLLHRLAGFGQEEIAEQLGISVSAIEKHVARAVAALAADRLSE
jgi:RNA polymerase sigma factor (sigma-70 family)